MGEKNHFPDKPSSGKSKDVQNPESTEDISESTDQEMSSETSEVDEVSTEEFESLNNQLDALSSALDAIESKNDNIHAQLLELLKANRQIREQLKHANLATGEDDMDIHNPDVSS